VKKIVQKLKTLYIFDIRMTDLTFRKTLKQKLGKYSLASNFLIGIHVLFFSLFFSLNILNIIL